MTECTSSITLRTATPADREFLKSVFAASRDTEVAALAADSAQLAAFIEMQFSVQQRNYEARFPSAENAVILVDNQPIGRLLVDRSAEALELIDIALLAEWRNQGIGTLLVQALTREAESKGKSVALEVYRANPARRLYERLGFSQTGEESLYIQMRWSPSTAT
jgi:GNAT superfamily N-acetyltransferase